MGIDRKLVLGLLDKVKASYTDGIKDSRAVEKLMRYVRKMGVPKKLTKKEEKYLKSLGVEIKKPPKPQPPKKLFWSEVAAKAVLTSCTRAEAEKTAGEIYMQEGGNREVDDLERWCKLYVNRAIKTLVVAEVIRMEGVRIIHTKEEQLAVGEGAEA